ncbi:MAG: hypothetical protein FJZ59_04090 [Chlamydiae bacterium]|jgi:hypothetical protein|nr:hypothetical protein [Chlamydiota bacterium]
MDRSDFFYSIERFDTREGFSDTDLVLLCSKIPVVDELIQRLSRKGFKYAGDTKTDSKAYTDVDRKRIYIAKDKTAEEACLSLAYELKNAENKPRIEAVFAEFLSDAEPTIERAMQYARSILLIEADAVLNRTQVAIETGLESSLKNKKYIDIVKATRDDKELALQEIFKEMVETGTVHNGKKKAIDHYVSQYFESQRAV